MLGRRRLALGGLWSLFAVSLSAAACRDEGSCAGPVSGPIFGGAATAGMVDLAPSERRAIGVLSAGPPQTSPSLCTGTLIAPGWVLTAAHCSGMESFTTRSGSGQVHAQAVGRAVFDPAGEALLLEVDPAGVAPDTAPIATLEEVLDDSWLGEPVDLAGYGLTETDGLGELRFVVEGIAAVDSALGIVTVDGHGRSGACAGDSGGPALTRGRDGTSRIAGLLLAGSTSCVGRDHYLMAEPLRPWIAEVTPAAVPAAGTPCGTTTTAGRCFRQTAVWCSPTGAVVAEACAAGRACGWDATSRGFRCIDPASDPCGGVDALGACRDGAALRCVEGALEEVACGACGQPCARAPLSGVVTCG